MTRRKGIHMMDAEREERIRQCLEELAELVDGNDEVYLLVAFIRMFHSVKFEYRHKPRRRRHKNTLQLNVEADA